LARRIPKAAVALITLGLAFWLLWNWAAVPLFTFPPLTYLQGLGAILLTALLTGICMLAAARRRKYADSAASPDDCRHWECRFGKTWKRDI
jgi:polyferredoxin